MNTKVIVLADEATKSVINMSKNEKFGYIRVKQTRFLTDEKSGFLTAKVLTALVTAPIEDLKEANFHEGQELTGKIVIEESLTPFNKKDPNRDLKVAGKTGIVCRLEGSPIYRRTRFTFNSQAEDKWVQHDNVSELRNAFDQEEKTSAIKPNEEFSING
jgi:hypothetical protein